MDSINIIQEKREPLVSIIIPIYNHEKYIEDCFNSIFNQNYNNLEILALDDGSIDQSFEIALKWQDKLQEKYSRVIIEKNNQNLGVCKTLNLLMHMCLGKYVFTLASDDALTDDGIRDLVDCAEKESSFGFIYSNGYIICDDERYPFTSRMCIYNDRQYTGLQAFDKIFENDFIHASGVLIPKTSIAKYGYFDERLLYEDWEYWLRLSRSERIVYLDKKTNFYRISPQSLSRNYDSSEEGKVKACKSFECHMLTMDMYKNQVGNKIMRKNGLLRIIEAYLDLAIESNNVQLIKKVRRYQKENHVFLRPRMFFKYCLYSIHFLPLISKLRNSNK